jgi:chromosomal replication initiation ATPase DnaA
MVAAVRTAEATSRFFSDYPQRDPDGQRLISMVAAARGLAVPALLSPTRGKAPVALARQIAMYLMHVVLSRSLKQTGTLFGRDRTTVAHACALIEDLREDPRFDAALDTLETLITEGVSHG